MKQFHLCLIPAFLIILFVSCATGPKNISFDAEQPVNEFADLPANGNAYLYIDVSEMRPVIDNISLGNISGSEAKDVLDRTDSGVIGMYPEESGRRFMISSDGKYPTFWSSVSMTFSSAWKKIKSETEIKYWRSEEQNLSLALSSQKAFLSDGTLFAAEQNVEVPENFSAIRQSAVMAGWIDKAGEKINPFLVSAGLPIQIPAERLLFAFYKAAESSMENPLYEGILHMEFPTVSQTRAVIAILNFAGMMAGAIDDSHPMGKIFKSILLNPPALDGNTIKLDAGIMTAEEITLLFNLFPVYSK
jgi:hypothetical protein